MNEKSTTELEKDIAELKKIVSQNNVILKEIRQLLSETTFYHDDTAKALQALEDMKNKG